MAKAMELIVDAYVRFNNRTALENLKSHRQRLAMEIQSRSRGFDYGRILEQIEEDLGFITTGLEKLP